MTDIPSDGFEDDDDAPRDASPRLIRITASETAGGRRLDRVLADAAPDLLSRARIKALMDEGAVTLGGVAITHASTQAKAGATYEIQIPPTRPANPCPQALPLIVLFEDAHLIVVDKAAGMAVHPAPGSPDGTLVNALLHHCGPGLSGIGGVARPGIVHRLDKDTSGVMVAAKTDTAHIGLSRLFATHDIERTYLALTRGVPHPTFGVIATRIGRSPSDRKKMAVLKVGGREAITHYRVERTYGNAAAARVSCTLETGRTHQIRVHLASRGTPCLADPVYGTAQPTAQVRAALKQSGLARQALHAAVLGFRHPITGADLCFQSDFPEDLATLEKELQAL